MRRLFDIFYRFKIRNDRTLKHGIGWWLTLSLFFYMLSIVISAAKSNDTNNRINSVTSTIQKANNHVAWINNTYILIFAGSLFCGMLFGALIWAWWSRYKRGNQILDGVFGIFTDRLTQHHALNSLFIASFITIAAILIAIFFSYPNDKLKILLDNPGGLFAIITGTATLMGTFVAIQSIIEMKQIITSYPQLINRLVDLIISAHGSEVKFVSLSPLPGSWQIKEKYKTELIRSLKHPERKMEVICLNSEDHLKLLKKIAKKGTEIKPVISEDEIQKFQNECESILQIFEGTEPHIAADSQEPIKKIGFRTPPKRIPSSDMPTYYFFVSDYRAIVVMPVGIPQTNEEAAPIEELTKFQIQISKKKIKVETLGFETTDRHIIESLIDDFNRLSTL